MNEEEIKKVINDIENNCSEYIFDNIKDCISTCYQILSIYAAEGVINNIGGPFGAAIIEKIYDINKNTKYKILTIARNTVISTKDVTCHAEINAIRKATKLLDNFVLDNCILVTTAKSCPMCLSASCWASIKTIYYGIDYSCADTSGFKDSNIFDYINGKNDSIIQEIYMKDENCIVPFKTWNNKENKVMY
mgnify:CR=1 FL=1